MYTNINTIYGMIENKWTGGWGGGGGGVLKN